MKKPKQNPRLRAAIFEIVENQLRDQTQPATPQTFQHLLAEGHTIHEAKRLIGCIVATEIYDVLKNQAPFNHARFVEALLQLPTLPWDTPQA